MRTFLIFTTIALLAVSCNSDNKEFLFNGENLDGWKIYVEDENIKPEEFFYVNNGMIKR